jgi:hypothetical protein
VIVTIGSILLALCGFPEAYSAWRRKECNIGWAMILMWLVGEILLSIFAIQTKQYILLINYFANLTFLGIMIKYK